MMLVSDRSRDHLPPDVQADLSVKLGMGAAFWEEETGEATATIRCAPEQTEADGSVPFGYLAAIADNNNAMANISSAKWKDNSILIEVAYQTTRAAWGTVEVRSRNSAYSDATGVAQGVMLDDNGPFGQSQCTSVTVPTRPMVDDRGELPHVEHLAFPWESDLTPAPIDVYLKGGLKLVEGGAIYTSQLDSGWSSNYGSLHGGAIGLLITRAMRYAAIAVSPTHVEQVPISFNINYVRPAMVVPQPMKAVARVIALTTRFCTLEGELVLPSGKPAARCRVIHQLLPKD
ncbi:MAG: PaaI family thioesterase [Acidimicrobiaceae bacterium]|nr:PaaI family thioesterase [Acidimicrobiaceae bacterium]